MIGFSFLKIRRINTAAETFWMKINSIKFDTLDVDWMIKVMKEKSACQDQTLHSVAKFVKRNSDYCDAQTYCAFRNTWLFADVKKILPLSESVECNKSWRSATFTSPRPNIGRVHYGNSKMASTSRVCCVNRDESTGRRAMMQPNLFTWFFRSSARGLAAIVSNVPRIHVSSSSIQNSQVDPFQRNRLTNAEDNGKGHLDV